METCGIVSATLEPRIHPQFKIKKLQGYYFSWIESTEDVELTERHLLDLMVFPHALERMILFGGTIESPTNKAETPITIKHPLVCWSSWFANLAAMLARKGLLKEWRMRTSDMSDTMSDKWELHEMRSMDVLFGCLIVAP